MEIENSNIYSLKKLKDIEKLYNELEEKQKIFTNTFCIHCIKGCGKCCEIFIPDITELESDYLAYGLIKEGIDDAVIEQLSNFNKDKIACPLYNPNSDKHCTVYAFRPLICRLFGASASLNKNGDPIYRDCKFKESKIDLTTEYLKNKKNDLVIMSNYGDLLMDEENGDTQKELLPVALIKSINKIKYLLSLEEETKKVV